MENKWYLKDIKEIYKILKTTKEGLTKKEVEKRLLEYGQNIIPKGKRESLLKMFFSEGGFNTSLLTEKDNPSACFGP